MIKIAYFHYHLKAGGVTTVIKQQIDAVKDRCEVLMLTGTEPDSELPVAFDIIPGAGYDRKGIPPLKPEDTAERITKAILSKWPEGCDILHIHNPIIAKNSQFIKTIKVLQEKGMNLFLQIHDFAEDGRPGSYFRDEYPADCHYGVINSRDYRILMNAGLKKKGLHKVFNMVNPFNNGKKRRQPENYILYPVRAIRRKNIGEAILLSLFFKNFEKLAITLPPNSRPDILSHEDWKKFALENDLNIEFEASNRNHFSDLVLNAKFILTTSITEGFGFSFIEPWAAGKFLWGRKLSNVCEDFEKRGIIFKDLYTKLNVPLEWLGTQELLEKQKSCFLKACRHFEIAPDSLSSEEIFDNAAEQGIIDFGLLNEYFQQRVISRIIKNRHDYENLIHMNPFLEKTDPEISGNLIEKNRNAILENYSGEIYRNTLLNVYTKVLNTRVCQKINKRALLLSFLNPADFSLLKWEHYNEEG